MKRSALIVLGLVALPFYLWASGTPSRPTSLEGAIENATEDTIDEKWCRTHPEECRAREEHLRALEFQKEEKEERQAYCDRFPERCDNQVQRKEEYERNKDCERYPWKCSDD